MKVDSSEPRGDAPDFEPFGRLWYRDPYGGSVGVFLPRSADLSGGELSDLSSGEDTWPIPSEPEGALLAVPRVDTLVLLPYLRESWGDAPAALMGCGFYSPDRRSWIQPDLTSVLERLLEDTRGPFENLVDPCPAVEFLFLTGSDSRLRWQSFEYDQWRLPKLRGRMNVSFPGRAREAVEQLLDRLRRRGVPDAWSGEKAASPRGDRDGKRVEHPSPGESARRVRVAP